MSYTAAVITVSDKGARGERADTSGPALCAMLRATGYEIAYTAIIPDEVQQIKEELLRCSDEKRIGLVLTTGGTGFSPRDVTPEATLAVVERETRGIPEAMRAASCAITPRGCLSRAAAGIRGSTLIVNLPGSEKAAKENLAAVLEALGHGMDMMASAGSADCASPAAQAKSAPSLDAWLAEAKREDTAGAAGMYLSHRGIVRRTAKAAVRGTDPDAKPVERMLFSADADKAAAAAAQAKEMPGICFVRVWLNEGMLSVGDDIMQVLIGGDIRPRVVDALQFLVGKLKSECVQETEF